VPDPKKDEEATFLLNYMVTAKELDDAIGVLRADLEKKGLTDKTVIVLFGDHNAYYNQLSNYVKGIEDYDTVDKNFTELYRVPLMIYDSSLGHQEIDKFTCTSDMVPTLLDLLGINY
jgi:phosphoglycerol transferase MdoB-like AlkP superfamily enzyme